MRDTLQQFFAPQAWVQGAWARDVLLTVDVTGHWCGVQADTPPAYRVGATVLAGPVLPGLVNAHSHAFQRAIVGLTEQKSTAAGTTGDDFWRWRDRMYSAARRITPEQLESIAALLYAELLAGGYTQVCEFHYLHNAADGAAHAYPLDMSLALVRAAQSVGMGLTLLPTLYRRSGFGASGLREDQRRFAATTDSLLRLCESLQSQTSGLNQVNVGVAIHSLRAVELADVKEIAAFAAQKNLPVHIHIAEQMQEVQDCLTHTSQRPIEWLLAHIPINAHWNLVHATHTTPAELQGVSASGAAIVICPSTEANLGDGVFDYSGFARVGGQWSIGSDSHVTRRWTEELRLLEYSQRLTQRQRNVAAQVSRFDSSAAAMFEAALAGGRSATSRALGSIAVGNRADFLVLETTSSALLGVPADNLLDALVFSSPDATYTQVYVAGDLVVQNGLVCGKDSEPSLHLQLQTGFVQTMQQLWSS
ncbi:MAG: formimidoylglutamate deiminase [Rhodoferax sp.]|uniref:formimidoylglutamate deiminase n=1 Tax=Rhodoferax sp. TaxID=50421 RepID=UPI0030162B8E